ncbi:peptidoglycan-binding domain-containing protein [Bosea vestrisii]|uniref:peptidoglycan-binding domain-containing protein n=1 Tax=Bosea vestrisii TaxID=151416 RepID=UPI0024E016A7|nr:peptidoglycan-binding domain-containing protein [Bosea vestrisii]WID96876.1 peptidoglycan-binding domain-containing protein [Bosea vestrisii]
MLKLGARGEPVRLLQSQLNLLPTGLVKLVVDGIFGTRTHGRVLEFQGINQLDKDGVVGPLTLDLIANLLRNLNNILPVPPPMPVPKKPSAVRLITDEIVGAFPAANGLITQIIPPIAVIQTATYKQGAGGPPLDFQTMPGTTGRLAIFAARNKDGIERAVILLLPAQVNPDRLLICISHGFGGQGAKTRARLKALNWTDPLSKPLIQYVLLNHVINRWGAQTLAAQKRNLGYMQIVRSGAPGGELGAFAKDAAFLQQVLIEMRDLTNGSFSFNTLETMTFSSGIGDHNLFVSQAEKRFDIAASYAIDPQPQARPLNSKGKKRLFRSGVTSHAPPLPGSDFLPVGRWTKEWQHFRLLIDKEFDYMHNWTMPFYCLYLGIQTS